MKVPYLDLAAQYRSLKDELWQALEPVLENASYVLGPAVESFEKDYAHFCGAKHCVGVNSGTSALVLALRAFDIGPGDEVITAANTFIATAAAIAHVGARPVLADVDPRTRNLDPAGLAGTITPATKAVIPVHLYGLTADMAGIKAVIADRPVVIIEDAAQAHGALYRGRPAGSLAEMAAFSFYPAKNLGALGEAGAVTTNDDTLAAKLRALRDHGSPKKYVHDLIGYNARMEGLQGAALGVKLRHLPQWNQRRRQIAALYTQSLRDLPLALPTEPVDCRHVYHLYVIECQDRDRLQRYLGEQGIPTLIHYPVPIHLQRAFRHLGYREGDYPVTERLARQILSLPIYPEMTDEQVDLVCQTIRGFFESR